MGLWFGVEVSCHVGVYGGESMMTAVRMVRVLLMEVYERKRQQWIAW